MYKDIKNYTKTKGFELCGITRAEYVGDYEYLGDWIKKGHNAGMKWMERNGDIRQCLSLLVENARTVIVVGKYYDDRRYDLTFPRIARYAQRQDYHIFFREKLTETLHLINKKYEVDGRIFVDSAPVLERYWAQKAGLGWIGRNGSLINREYGAFILLGGIILSGECDFYDEPDGFNGCGTCGHCRENCPTGALLTNGTVDCNICLSYLTVERRGEFTETENTLVKNGGWLYGCDICTEVCPWSIKAARKHGLTDHSALPYSRQEFLNIPNMSNSEFKKLFGPTPVFHSGKKNVARNIGVFYKEVRQL